MEHLEILETKIKTSSEEVCLTEKRLYSSKRFKLNVFKLQPCDVFFILLDMFWNFPGIAFCAQHCLFEN